MKKFLLVIIYFFSPILPILIIYSNNPEKYTDINLLLSMILGSASYTYLSWQFILSARPRFVDKVFGMDRAYRFHGVMALFSIIMVVMHKSINENVFSESFMTQLGEFALIIYIIVSAVTVLLMVNSFVLKIQPFKGFRKIFDKLNLLRYQHYRWIHNITLLSLFAMQVHVLQSSAAKKNFLVFNVYMAYFLLSFGFYFFHKVVKPWVLKAAVYEVVKVVAESKNIYSIHFTPTKGEKIQYKAGQFGFFKFISAVVSNEEHPFSISSSPDAKELSITVKELGDYTKNIRLLKPGNLVFVEAPYGHFSYEFHPKEEAVVFIAGGVGITPVLSMLRKMRDSNYTKPVLLLWGMNTLEDYIVKDELSAILDQLPNIQIIPIVAFDKSYTGEKGFIDFEKIQRLVSQEKWFKKAGFYICGPAVLMDNSISNLKKLGIKATHIHFEKFSL